MPQTWLEFRTTDVSAATTFLTATFGWTYVTVQLAGNKLYYKFKDSNNVFRAGLVLDQQVRVIGYIWVDEPDAIVTNALQNGGTVVAQGTGHPVLGTWAILDGPNTAPFGVMNGNP